MNVRHRHPWQQAPLAQSELVAVRLRTLGADVTIQILRTSGDEATANTPPWASASS